MPERPTLVFTFADQLRLQSCGYSDGYADDPEPYTPNVDGLAGESADFRNAVSGSPICAPYLLSSSGIWFRWSPVPSISTVSEILDSISAFERHSSFGSRYLSCIGRFFIDRYAETPEWSSCTTG